MKEKGFTLIELLAVILILGIIALIAIPAVTKIVEESRIKAFKETNQNIASVVEGECQASQINGTGSTAGYSFTKDGASGDIGVKGKLPTGGSVVSDSSCNSMVYTTNDRYCAVKTAADDEVVVGKIEDGNCSVIMNDDSYCTSDSNPGALNGTGTEIDPYLIESIEDLTALIGIVDNDADNFLSKYVKLNNNLDFKNSCSYVDETNTSYGDINGDGEVNGLMTELTTKAGFLPIGHQSEYNGNSNTEYSGNFDGGNYYISNLYINRPAENSVGLFGYTYSNNNTQKFKNINIVNSVVTGAYQTSLLVGNVTGSDKVVTFDNIYVAGDVKGIGSTSLFIGNMSGVGTEANSISNITTVGNVTNINESYGSYTAGVIAYATTGGTYKNIKNYANVLGLYATGGIFGKVEYASMSDVYNYGAVTDEESNNSIGGIIGYTNGYELTLKNAYNYGKIEGKQSVGGIIGYNGGGTSIKSNLSNLNNYGDVWYSSFGSSASNDYFGGVAGYIGGGILTTANNYGNIYGINRTGGIVGNASALSVVNAANYGEVYGQYSIGGITGTIGQTGSALTNVLNYGEIFVKSFETGGNNCLAGGISGYTGDTIITNAYSTGNISVESNNGYWSFIGGIVGRVDSYSTPVSIINAYSNTNIDVKNNYASASNGFFGGIVGFGYSASNLTNVYYSGNITTNLSTKTVGTIIASGVKTLTNGYYNNENIANFNVIDGIAVNNSSVNTSWFKDTLSLGSAFDYSSGIYPRLYTYGTTTLIPGQKEKNL